MALENVMYCPNSYVTNDSCTHIHSLVQMVECFSQNSYVTSIPITYIHLLVQTDLSTIIQVSLHIPWYRSFWTIL